MYYTIKMLIVYHTIREIYKYTITQSFNYITIQSHNWGIISLDITQLYNYTIKMRSNNSIYHMNIARPKTSTSMHHNY